MLKSLVLIKDVSLSCFELVLLHLKVFYFLIEGVLHLFKLFWNLRVTFSDCLNLVTLMLAMDNTLSTDRRTMASETEVGDELLWMTWARNCHSRCRSSEIWDATILRVISFIEIIEWRGSSLLLGVKSARIWGLTLQFIVSFAILGNDRLSHRLDLLKSLWASWPRCWSLD